MDVNDAIILIEENERLAAKAPKEKTCYMIGCSDRETNARLERLLNGKEHKEARCRQPQY